MRPRAVGRVSLRVVPAALVLVGCAFEPQGDRPIEPPAKFRTWFAKTEACSGLSGEFQRIRWFVVDGAGFDCPGGKCVGRWNDDHRIFIAGDYLDNELVVRHEMLHDLIDHPGHPDPPFGIGCPLTWATWRGSDTATTTAVATPFTGRVAQELPPRID